MVSKTFRERTRAGEVVLGAFIKSASHQVAEVLGHCQLDFIVVDAEHAPFDAADIDRIVLAARTRELPCLVRTPDHSASFIGRCLDLGASGILAPHVTDTAAADRVIAAAKYSADERGFSPSGRAGAFGTTPAAAYRVEADRQNSIWCQIEDASALDHLDAIAAKPDVDCLFVGRADLALSLGVERPDDAKMETALQAVAAAAKREACAFGIYMNDPAEMPGFLKMGATVFICGSDQSWLLAQGRAIRQALARATGASAA
jgi:2-keto-3-deoxy-L-rhamnonate aldolase RhmA